MGGYMQADVSTKFTGTKMEYAWMLSEAALHECRASYPPVPVIGCTLPSAGSSISQAGCPGSATQTTLLNYSKKKTSKCTYKVTLWHIYRTTVAVEKYHVFWVCF
jgi:hypothetical protein